MARGPDGYTAGVKKLLRRVAGRVFRRGPKPGTPVTVRFGARDPGPGKVGQTLLEAAKEQRVDIDSFCGGRCSCGTCRVKVVRGALVPMDLNEQVVLGSTAVTKGYRLACQARLQGDTEVEVPEFFGVG